MAAPPMPIPTDVGFSPTGDAGSTGGLSSLFGGGSSANPSSGKAPSSGLWAQISKYIGELDPEAMEEELKYIQQMVGGFNKINAASGQSKLAQRLMQEGKLSQQPGAEGGQVKPYAAMPGGPTVLPQMGPNVTPDVAASMLRTMGLR